MQTWGGLRTSRDATTDKEPLSSLVGKNSRGEEWELVQRIVKTPPFVRSAFLTRFLLYICDRKLENRESEITEYQIGVRAFGRPSSYNPSEDNIVRNYARMLRARLEGYFAGEGNEERLRIVVPRGQYLPRFEPWKAPTEPELPSVIQETAPVPPPAPRTQRIPLLYKVVIGLAIFAACGVVAWMRTGGRGSKPALFAAFWGEVFSPSRTTYVVAADSGIEILQDMTGRPVHLQEYVNGNLDEIFPKFAAVQHRLAGNFGPDEFTGYTSVADLNAVVGFLRLPESAASHVVVRYARGVNMDDLRQSNVILLGGPHANPWVELFESGSAFRMDISIRLNRTPVDERSIVNVHPRAGEPAEFRDEVDAGRQITYAIVSFVPSVDNAGHALLIEGENMAATRAGANFVLNSTALQPILEKARLPDGTIGRFELVLQAQTVGADAPEAHPVAERESATDAR